MKKNNTWNIRRLVEESLVSVNQRTSTLYCRFSDFQILVNLIQPLTLILKVIYLGRDIGGGGRGGKTNFPIASSFFLWQKLFDSLLPEMPICSLFMEWVEHQCAISTTFCHLTSAKKHLWNSENVHTYILMMFFHFMQMTALRSVWKDLKLRLRFEIEC